MSSVHVKGSTVLLLRPCQVVKVLGGGAGGCKEREKATGKTGTGILPPPPPTYPCVAIIGIDGLGG